MISDLRMIGRQCAPQHQIENLKKKTMELQKKQDTTRAAIHALDEMFHKKKTLQIDYQAKFQQCKADKIEIMRDLATYEVNFSRHCVFKKHMADLLHSVMQAKKMCR